MSWYRTGLVSVASGSPNVTGSGTAWFSVINQGDAFVGPDGRSYEVIDVSSDTSLTLGSNYAGTTVSGASYQVFPTQGYLRSLASQVTSLILDLNVNSAPAATLPLADAVTVLVGQFGASRSATLRQVREDQCVTPERFGATGDGVADDGQAVADAFATGKNVKLTAKYRVNGRVFLPVAGQRIFGGGRLVKTAIGFGGEQFISVVGVDNVHIEDIEFEDTRTSGARSYGVTIQNARGTKVRGNRFLGYETGVFVWRLSRQTDIVGNTMAGGDFGVAVGGDAAGNTNGAVSDTLIAFNTIRDQRGEGIDLNWDVQGCRVMYNTVLDCGSIDGEEDIDIGGGVCRDIDIIGNTLNSNGRCHRNIWVKLNTQRVTIARNRMFGATINGVLIGSSGSALQDIKIVDHNIIEGGGVATGRGIEINDTSQFVVSDTRVRGFVNDGIAALPTSSDGDIALNDVSECEDGIVCLSPSTRIVSNKARVNRRVGINAQAIDLTVIGNHSYDNASEIDGTFGFIISAGSNRIVFSGNKAFDTRGASRRQNGVLVVGACDEALVEGNIIGPIKATQWSGIGLLTRSVVRDNIPFIDPQSAVVADDSVVTVVPPATTGFIEVWADGSSAIYGRRYFRLDVTAAMGGTYAGGASFASTTGALTGTTGVDGLLTISGKTDGTIDIENRTGVSRTVRWRWA